MKKNHNTLSSLFPKYNVLWNQRSLPRLHYISTSIIFDKAKLTANQTVLQIRCFLIEPFLQSSLSPPWSPWPQGHSSRDTWLYQAAFITSGCMDLGQKETNDTPSSCAAARMNPTTQEAVGLDLIVNQESWVLTRMRSCKCLSNHWLPPFQIWLH